AGRARECEARGDAALERFSYVEAITRFEQALLRSYTAKDEVRLCEKIGRAIFYSARPDIATIWFERARERCIGDEAMRKRESHLLILLQRQYWLEFRTADALACLERAYELALLNFARDAGRLRRRELMTIERLTMLEEYGEAEARLLKVEKPSRSFPIAHS